MALQWKKIDENGNKVKSAEAEAMPPWLIHPFHPGFRAFLYCTVVMAAVTGVLPKAHRCIQGFGRSAVHLFMFQYGATHRAKQALLIYPFLRAP